MLTPNALDTEFVRLLEKAQFGAQNKANLLLTWGGFRPTCAVELVVSCRTEEEMAVFLTEEEIAAATRVVRRSGLHYLVKPIEKVEGQYTTRAELDREKTYVEERIDVLVARSREDLAVLNKYWGTSNDKMIGKALGFPPTAIDAFIGKRKRLKRDSLPQSIRESDALAFSAYALSKDNWREEVAEGKRRAEFVKRNSPEIYRAVMRIYLTPGGVPARVVSSSAC